MTVTVQGNYTQTAGGSLSLKIKGTQSGIGDHLSSTGTATLGGTLNVASVGTPVNGVWTMVSGATLTGSFANINLPTPPAQKYWQYGHCAAQFSLAI